jgi:DNA-binding beta-propeller fold protein YncE
VATHAAASAAQKPDLIYPNAITVDSLGRIYFTEGQSHRVFRIEDMDGHDTEAFGSEGKDPGQFLNATAIWLDGKGRIYVADPYLDRISRFDGMDGSGCVTLGRTGFGAGCLNAPLGGCVDSRGRVYVADWNNNRIVRFDDMDGSGWTTLGGPDPGEGPGQFDQPHGIFVDSAGFIYVSVHPATVVRMNEMDGSGWVRIRPANLRLHWVRYTRGLTVDEENNAIYLALSGNYETVIRIAGLTGLRWTSLGPRPGSSRSNPRSGDALRTPIRMCLDAKHRLYIADNGNHRIVRVDDIYGNGWAEYPPPASPPASGNP